MPLHRMKERALIAQLLLDLTAMVRVGRMRDETSLEIFLVGGAVLIGQAHDRPRNASEIARAVGLPRATVTRKLQELVALGAITRDGTRYLVNELPPGAESYIDAAIHAIRTTAHNLTR